MNQHLVDASELGVGLLNVNVKGIALDLSQGKACHLITDEKNTAEHVVFTHVIQDFTDLARFFFQGAVLRGVVLFDGTGEFADRLPVEGGDDLKAPVAGVPEEAVDIVAGRPVLAALQLQKILGFIKVIEVVAFRDSVKIRVPLGEKGQIHIADDAKDQGFTLFPAMILQ